MRKVGSSVVSPLSGRYVTNQHMEFDVFEYLSTEVFVTPESKATAVSIIVSSCIAILVVFINKWVADCREVKQKKITKLEEIAFFLSELKLLGTKYIDGNDNDVSISSASELAQIELALNKIESLLILHFPKETFFDKNSTLETLRNTRIDFVKNRTMYQMSKSHKTYSTMIDAYWIKLHVIMKSYS
ncbi:hypothetical protein [Vibrio metschnikovii]|uniref:hypothetical protein n=1 Tax=Vibrio metschnikovii TaxID=28172 RepID=UPI001C303814|nr:hypothetical protein [Vibrio metschnikovii]